MRRALFIAPAGAVGVYAVLVLLDPFDWPGGVLASLAFLAAVSVVGYLAELIVAWPLFLALQKRGLASPLVCVTGGVVLGLLIAGVFDLPTVNVSRWRYYAAAGIAGLSSGRLFAYEYFWRPNTVRHTQQT